MTREEYLKKGLVELRRIAEYMNISDIAEMRKAELVDMILSHPNPVDAAPAVEVPEKRRRGRPKKSETVSIEAGGATEIKEEAPVVKKRPGRPKKDGCKCWGSRP